ncbi:hypothetical protein [Nitrosopumilus sp.]|uniref:hypothetical protein n=1 Tax=Nitrosopumilus sp. TaxID=2024843 RepID=UPI0029313F74|nr:hypothetical protein [Nitrosopumilus sp.]
MEIAHVLVTCENKREDDVINEMRSIKEVREIKKDIWSIQCSNKSRGRISSKD